MNSGDASTLELKRHPGARRFVRSRAVEDQIASPKDLRFVLIDMVGVSRRHAMIAVAGELITLTDLGSKNGTFANGERITAPVALIDDTEIRLGPVPIRFRLLAQGASTQTFDASRLSRPSQ